MGAGQRAALELWLTQLLHRLDFDDELPSLDHERIAERCAHTCRQQPSLSGHLHTGRSAAKLQHEVTDILQAARRGCLLSTGVQARKRCS